MKQRCNFFAFGIFLAGLLVSRLFAFAEIHSVDWNGLKPLVTTDDEFVRIYGTPNTVSIELTYDVFQEWLKDRTLKPSYVLKYDIFSKNTKLLSEGPLGECERADVMFGGDRKLIGVHWTYENGYRFHAATHESPTKITVQQIEESLGHPAIQRRPRIAPKAALYRISLASAVLEVEYLSDQNDIQVHLTKNGLLSFQ